MTDFITELENSGRLVYKNKGVSMMPLLRQDKDVIVIKAKKSGFQKNDAVLFIRTNGQYILHRIRKVLPDNKFYIIGDNCTKGEIVPEDRIIGILTEVIKDGKSIKITDRNYLFYVRSVPIRRFFFTHYRFCRSVLSKIYHKIKNR